MKVKNIITINGRSYDTNTGLPTTGEVAPAKAAHSKPSRPQTAPKPAPKNLRAFSDIGPATAVTHLPPRQRGVTRPSVETPLRRTTRRQTPHTTIHKKLQKSQTLYRSALKRPEPQVAPPKPAMSRHRADSAAQFAPHPKTSPSLSVKTGLLSRSQSPRLEPKQPSQQTQTVQAAQAHTAPQRHPAIAQAPKSLQHSSKELKESLIKERIAEAEAAKANQPKKSALQRVMQRQPKLATIVTSSFALLLLGGYFTYLNLPNLSMKVAATRAGINANFPNYKPDGYGLNGAIAYSPGEVSINFKSNTNNLGYSVKQKSSTWDSQAVLDNYVSKQTDAYLTFQERGLMIYTYGNKAAWVDGGLLYTIDGDAPLSSDQILKIASSM